MIERLEQLQRKNKQFIPFSTAPLSAQTLAPHENPYELQGIQQRFFKKVIHARALIQRIQQNNDKVQETKVKYDKAIKSHQQKDCSTEMQRIITQNSSIHAAVKKLLEDIKIQVQDCQKNQQLKDQPETKMKKNLFQAVTKQLATVVQQERVQQDGYKNTVRKKITRQVKMVDSDLNQQEIQHYANHPEEAQQMLQRKIYGQASTTLKNAVSDIQDKFKDIQRLEHSVNECLHLFKQLSAMVYAQGQVIDNIELNVQQAKDYVQKGQKKLVEAKKHHKCTKKCMCWAIIISVIVLVVLLAIVIPTAIKAVK